MSGARLERTLSEDGTPIAFERTGRGPALVLVDGALCHRAMGPSGALAAALAERFTVLVYDRRGRGDSGDTQPYALEREIEDLAALLGEAGGSAYVCGLSSGGALALEAAQRGLPIEKLAVYEAPFIVDDQRAPIPEDFLDQLEAALAAGRRGEAVKLFMKLVGTPAFAIALMRWFPVWSKLESVAHTLPYDIALVKENERGLPLRPAQWAGATLPALVLDGGKSPAWMRNAMRALAAALPNAESRTLAGQTHMVKPKALAPALGEFFRA